MPLRKLLFFLNLLLLVPVLIYAQSAKTKIFRTEENWLERTPLHNQEVYDILQDSRGFMWFATFKGLIKFDGASFTIYEHNPNDINSIGFSSPIRLAEDKQGKIWVSAHNGISIFDPKLESFTKYKDLPHSGGSFSYNYVWAFAADINGTIWLGADSGLCSYHPTEKKFTCFPEFAYYISDLEIENDTILWIPNHNQNLIKFNTNNQKYSEVWLFDENGKQILEKAEKILITGNGEFWIYTSSGLLYRRKSKLLQSGKHSFHRQKEMDGVQIFKMTSSRNGDVWIAGKRGLYCFDSKSEEFFHIAFEGNNQEANSEYYGFLEDNRSHFWVGYENGVVKWNSEQEASFVVYDDFPSQKKEKSQVIETIRFEKIDSQRMLVGRFDGLFVFDQKEKKITPAATTFPQLSGLDTFAITYLFKDSKSGIWISASDLSLRRGLLLRLDLITKKVASISEIGGETFAMAESKDQTYWIGTWGGLLHYDLQKGVLKSYQHDSKNPISLSDNNVLALSLEHDSLLWIGTRGGGLNCFDVKTEQFRRFQYNPLDSNSLSNNQVVDVHIDSEGSLWAATYGGGLCKLDKGRQGFKRFLKDQGLNTLKIAAIEEDDRNQIWVGTSEGVSSLDKYSGLFQNHNVNNGAPFLVSWIASVKDSEGFLYFGGKYSFVRFHPQHLKRDTVTPKLVFSEFYLNNKLVLPQQKNSPLEESISYTNSITLKHHQNFIRLKFAALNFIQPEKNQYAYRMEGLLDEWQFLSDKHEVTFTNLDAGEYVLHVRGSNHEGLWNEKGISLKITILPPWYRTWWAYLLYVLTIGGILFAIRNYELKRQLAKAEAQRLQELDLAKSRLYTNITHEFRTPLTVILGMAEQVKSDPKNWFNEGLQLIRRNGKQLLHLVNQLLDLSKLESGHMPLNLVQGDIVNYLKYLTESFHSYADSKDIRLHFRSDFPELHMDHDPEKLQNVLSNLLSNAIKFTPAGGDVYVDLRLTNDDLRLPPPIVNRHSSIVIQVRDNGIGIPPEHLPHIFDRFYQADATHTRRGEGTGIGLALTKELVKLMGGEIEVESPDPRSGGKGTKFTLHLPIHKAAEKSQPSIPNESPSPLADTLVLGNEKTSEGVNVPPGDRHLVLLIEDNPDVTTYLASFLSSDYRIITASNGQEGIEKAIETVPDLVVSDVMMPGKDGFEVCQTLKTDERTSHIPVILLTAKADLSSKIEGLKHGADAYLAKPFNKEELLVRLEKLIELRQQLQVRFGQFPKFVKSKPASLEDIFLQNVIVVIEKNLSDEDFGLPELCRQLHMSRSQVFRKLKALTGKSTTHFIRSIRLAKAKVLLETTSLPVSEVGYETGFGNPAYFSRMFQEEFGMTPSGVRK